MNELVKLCSLVSMAETMPHDKNRVRYYIDNCFIYL